MDTFKMDREKEPIETNLGWGPGPSANHTTFQPEDSGRKGWVPDDRQGTRGGAWGIT